MRTRPDAAFAVSKLASSMAKNPGATLPLVKHLMGYLFGSVELVLVDSHNMPMRGTQVAPLLFLGAEYSKSTLMLGLLHWQVAAKRLP